MDGEGKNISISTNASELAIIKQAPYLIREIQKIMPKLNIDIWINHDHNKNVFLDDMKFNEIDSSNISYCKYSHSGQPDLQIWINYSDSEIRKDNFIQIPIDNLKFEKRRLLNEDKINDLKEKYKIRKNEKVILAGSIRNDEIRNIAKSLKYVSNEDKNAKIILVPRYSEDLLFNPLKLRGFDYECDSKKITGDKRYILVGSQGFLDRLYSISDIVLIGNTFYKDNDSHDGQNPLEPAFYGKRILSGCAYREWNLVAYNGLEKSGLLKRVEDSNELEKELLRDIPDSRLRYYQDTAAEFISSQQGAAKIYADIIQKDLYKLLTKDDKKFLSKKRSLDDLKNRKFGYSKSAGIIYNILGKIS